MTLHATSEPLLKLITYKQNFPKFVDCNVHILLLHWNGQLRISLYDVATFLRLFIWYFCGVANQLTLIAKWIEVSQDRLGAKNEATLTTK